MTPGTSSTQSEGYEVAVVGGGVAGLSAGLLTARHGLETLVLGTDEPVLTHSTQGETNLFATGIDSDSLLDMLWDQFEDAGCGRRETMVTGVERADRGGFLVETACGETVHTDYVVAATKDTTEYLDGIGTVDCADEFVATDERGRTCVSGLYAVCRSTDCPLTEAGHGAATAATLLHDVGRELDCDPCETATHLPDSVSLDGSTSPSLKDEE